MTDFRQPFTPFHKRWCTECTKTLLGSPFSAYFRNHPRESVPNFDEYCQVIRNPIWLREVLERLRLSSYLHVHEWVADMKGIWENAIAYNAPDSPGHDCAIILQDMFETKCLPVPNSEADILLIEKERILQRIHDHVLDPPESIRSLSWEICRVAGFTPDGLEEIPWGEAADIEVSEAIRAALDRGV
jgi:hypothetical protein